MGIDNEFVDPADDLTPEELEQLRGLTDPDAEDEAAFKWDEEFQRYILAMLVSDRHFLVQSLPLVKPKYFTDEVHKLICDLLFEHFDEYKVLPRKAWIVQEIKDKTEGKKDEVKMHYLQELGMVYDHYTPGIESRDYLLDKIVNFAKMQAVKVAFSQCLTQIKRDPESDGTWMNIQAILRDALLVDKNFDPGLDYFQSYEERYEAVDEEEVREVFTTGFHKIDEALLGGGPTKGEIYSWIGLSGTGKSLALVRASVLNVTKLGKRVLYISLEMDEKKIAERFDAQIADIDINRLQENKSLIKKAFEEELKDTEDPRLLIIKQFTPGTMDVGTLRAYLQQLSLVGFKPDLLIVDYIGEMKDYPNMPTWESRYRIVRDLRGLASEEDVCILTAMQPNKGAREAQEVKDRFGNLQSGVIDDNNLADAFGQIRPLDGCWSINQTHFEKKADIARVFVIKHRHGKSRYTFHIEYEMAREGVDGSKTTLAMREISENRYNDRVKREQSDTITRTQELPNTQTPDGDLGKKAREYFSDDRFDNDEGPTGPESDLTGIDPPEEDDDE
jgi:replicative DNA helicase